MLSVLEHLCHPLIHHIPEALALAPLGLLKLTSQGFPTILGKLPQPPPGLSTRFLDLLVATHVVNLSRFGDIFLGSPSVCSFPGPLQGQPSFIFCFLYPSGGADFMSHLFSPHSPLHGNFIYFHVFKCYSMQILQLYTLYRLQILCLPFLAGCLTCLHKYITNCLNAIRPKTNPAHVVPR